ncbi:DUF2798 domain-containing protein [Anaeromicropila populeti]|uniref:DUF2798 domain-containing protein n=1 Tax=Anaeromicropila populeti TaxID=37658 RepID=A0A1I6J0T8_9FIRM|nr:DUF2798 domain-containing protein [Anaeromicropila populeti]SFR72548.1 Protein of unknown function [Anaeromicropila populeti]
MPQNRRQETIYTIMMVIVMVYAMICYNIALETGSMKNFIFLAALSELPIMGVVGFILDTFIAAPLAKKAAFKLVTPDTDKPFLIILAISVLSIWLMCPMMSLAATILFKGGFHQETISTWIQTTVLNFPMAFFLQLFIAGPLVRVLFKRLIPNTK